MYFRVKFDEGFGSFVVVSFNGKVALAREQFPKLMRLSSSVMWEKMLAYLKGPGMAKDVPASASMSNNIIACILCILSNMARKERMA